MAQRGVEVVHEDSRYRILRITAPKALAAMSRGTRWCTLGLRPSDYLHRGPVYVVFRDGLRYALLRLVSGDLVNEAYADVVPDAELSALLERLFPPTGLSESVSLSLVLGRPLLTMKQERVLLRWWSTRYDAYSMIHNFPLENFAEYLSKYYATDPAARRRLLTLVRAELASGRLDVATKLDWTGFLPMRRHLRLLRQGIQRCYALGNLAPVVRYLRDFQETDLTSISLSYLDDREIARLWKLFRLEPATRLAGVVVERANEDPAPRRDFLKFYRELKSTLAERWSEREGSRARRIARLFEPEWRRLKRPPRDWGEGRART